MCTPLKKEQKKEQIKETPRPEYDALYEPIKTELSLSDAKDIEERSWVTTELLTDGIEEYEDEPVASIAPPPQVEKDIKEEVTEGDLMIEKALDFLINNDKQGFIALSKEMGVLPDALCEAVNDRLYDTLGDIAVEQNGGEYSIVVDYMEEISQWLKTLKR